MEAQYIARKNDNCESHTVRDGWTYSNISDARTGCGIKGPFAIEHLQSGRGLPVTCRRAGCDGSKEA